MRKLDELYDVDFPPCGAVTKASISTIQDNSQRYRGSFRMATGRIWVNSEFEAHREAILNKPLP